MQECSWCIFCHPTTLLFSHTHPQHPLNKTHNTNLLFSNVPLTAGKSEKREKSGKECSILIMEILLHSRPNILGQLHFLPR